MRKRTYKLQGYISVLNNFCRGDCGGGGSCVDDGSRCWLRDRTHYLWHVNIETGTQTLN